MPTPLYILGLLLITLASLKLVSTQKSCEKKRERTHRRTITMVLKHPSSLICMYIVYPTVSCVFSENIKKSSSIVSHGPINQCGAAQFDKKYMTSRREFSEIIVLYDL